MSSAQAFFSSHRNSLEAHLSLLDATQCHTILLPDRAPTITRQILAARPMQVLSMPSLEFFMTDSDDVEAYHPLQGTFDEMRDKTLVILHTSGSTGIPKTVFVTHGTFACNDAHQLIPSLGGNPTTVHYIKGKRFFLAFPLFHATNLTFTIGFNIYSGVTCVLPPPGPLTVDVVNMVHTYGNLDGSLLPPSMIIDISKNSEYLVNMLRQLQFVAYVGGTLPKEIGDTISSSLKLITLMGSTETMLFPIELNTDHADWQYLHISPFLGHEFRLYRDGLRELVIVRNEKLDLFQGVFSTFPNIDEYPMSDLYEQHPTRPGSWAFRARADDIIAFNNGEKLNPVTMEGIISAHPAVNSAIIGGHGEFQAALLVEPKASPTTSEEREQLLYDIWPTVVQANHGCPAHGRIMKNFVMFTSPEKPIPRAGKDTVQRYATLKLYATEFKALYAASYTPLAELQNGVPNGKPKPPRVTSESSTPTPTVERAPATCGRTAKLPADYRTVHSSVSSPAVTYSLSDLDTRIEAILHRILPDVLREHLGPTLAQMLAKQLHLAMAQINVSSQVNATEHSTVPEPNGPQVLAQGSSEKAHRNGNGIDHSTFPTVTSSDTDAPEDLRDSLYRAISSSTYLQNLTDEADLFECGLDSLQVPVLVNEINALLSKTRLDVSLISSNIIYDNPSIEKLLMALNGSPNNLAGSDVRTTIVL